MDEVAAVEAEFDDGEKPKADRDEPPGATGRTRPVPGPAEALVEYDQWHPEHIARNDPTNARRNTGSVATLAPARSRTVRFRQRPIGGRELRGREHRGDRREGDDPRSPARSDRAASTPYPASIATPGAARNSARAGTRNRFIPGPIANGQAEHAEPRPEGEQHRDQHEAQPGMNPPRRGDRATAIAASTRGTQPNESSGSQ